MTITDAVTLIALVAQVVILGCVRKHREHIERLDERIAALEERAYIDQTIIECESCGQEFEFAGELSNQEIAAQYRAHVELCSRARISHEQESEDGD